MNNLSNDRLKEIEEAADEVLQVLAGNHEKISKDDDSKICQLWDGLNDKYAPPEVIKSVISELLAYREAAEKPVAYIDNDELERLADDDSGVVRTPNFGPGYQSATIPLFSSPPLTAWISVKDDMPNPEDKRRVCAYTPSEHSDFEYRSVPASLFKVVCSAATHWCYFSPPSELTAPQLPVVPDERSAFNAWNNDESLPIAGIGAKNAAWLAWQARSKLVGNSPVIPDGWALVPIEPTEKMIVEGFESEPDETFSEEKEWEAYQAMSGCEQAAHRARLCWAAMLAAAPKPPAQIGPVVKK